MITPRRKTQQNFQSRIHFVGLCLVLVFCIGSFGCSVVAQDRELTATSSSHRQEVSMGDSLRRPGSKPLHILYVHGIGAIDSGDSYTLRKKICDFLENCTTPAGEISLSREYADVEDFDLCAPRPTWTYLGSEIWKTREEWHAAAPFVDHYVLTRTKGKSILVDEINWWPLTMALKCRQILKDESQLAGADSSFLGLCAQKTSPAKIPGRFDSFDWLSPDTVRSLEQKRSRAVYLNRSVKIGLMDWGMSDALLAVGPMQDMLVESLRQLLVKCVAASGDEPKALAELVSGDAGPSDSEYVVVSHSLGSFLIFSALNSQKRSTAGISRPGNTEALASSPTVVAGAFTYVLRHTGQAYFFANQVSLLELAMLRNPSQPADNTSYAIDLAHWGEVRSRAGGSKPQVVAWSDADDLLSWHVPDIQGVNVVNLYARNAFHWFGIFEGPLAAHDKYASNKNVISVLLSPKEVPHKDK
jgi:hypothetical protein